MTDRQLLYAQMQLLCWPFLVFRIFVILLRGSSILFPNEIQGDFSIIVNWIFVTFSVVQNFQIRESGPLTASAISSSSNFISASSASLS